MYDSLRFRVQISSGASLNLPVVQLYRYLLSDGLLVAAFDPGGLQALLPDMRCDHSTLAGGHGVQVRVQK